MDRRTFLKASSITAATAAATTGSLTSSARIKNAKLETSSDKPQTSQNSITVATSSPFPDNLAGPSDQLHKLATSIKQLSNGRIDLAIDTAPTPQSNSEWPRGAGNIDAMFMPLHWSPHAHTASLYYSGMPHVKALSATELIDWLSTSGGQTMWDSINAAQYIKPLLAGHLGETPALWSTTRIQNLTDLAGKKVASAGAPPELLRAIGATPVSLPPEHMAEALKSGKIDVAECGSLHTAMSLRIHLVANYAAKGTLTPSGTALALAFTTHAWQGLSEAEQALVTTCANENYRAAINENRALERPLEIALNDHHNVEVSSLETRDNASWQRLADTFAAHIATADDLAAAINASYSAFAHRVS